MTIYLLFKQFKKFLFQKVNSGRFRVFTLLVFFMFTRAQQLMSQDLFVTPLWKNVLRLHNCTQLINFCYIFIFCFHYLQHFSSYVFLLQSEIASINISCSISFLAEFKFIQHFSTTPSGFWVFYKRLRQFPKIQNIPVYL